MSKYDPLKDFLAVQPGDRIPMTFGEIERVLGLSLPKSKQYPAWWSNSPSNNTMTQAWLDAGFATEQVDTGSERLVFRRIRNARAGAGAAEPPGSGALFLARLRAKLGGTVKVAEGVDLTEPSGETWDAER